MVIPNSHTILLIPLYQYSITLHYNDLFLCLSSIANWERLLKKDYITFNFVSKAREQCAPGTVSFDIC